jgi:hypothetical protein
MKPVLLFLIVALSLFIMPQESFGKTYVYFVGPKGKIAKLDTVTNAVSQLSLKMPSGETLDKVLGADRTNNRLYVTHYSPGEICKVGVYDLKTLAFVKKLPLESLDPSVEMVIYPDGSKFLIQYFTPGDGAGEGGYTTDLYDGKELVLIKNLSTIFGMDKVMFSIDGKKIYSITGGVINAKVTTIDSTTFEELASKDLTQIWRKQPEVFSAGVENYGSGKVLIHENLQFVADQPAKDDLYTYDVVTANISPRISTGLQGHAMLSNDGQCIIYDEYKNHFYSSGMYDRSKSLGRLHIYDVATAKELGSISFEPKGQGKVRGISPAGDTLYYQSEGDTPDTSKIVVIDIKNYSVTTTINLPFKALSMVFFEE